MQRNYDDAPYRGGRRSRSRDHQRSGGDRERRGRPPPRADSRERPRQRGFSPPRRSPRGDRGRSSRVNVRDLRAAPADSGSPHPRQEDAARRRDEGRTRADELRAGSRDFGDRRDDVGAGAGGEKDRVDRGDRGDRGDRDRGDRGDRSERGDRGRPRLDDGGAKKTDGDRGSPTTSSDADAKTGPRVTSKPAAEPAQTKPDVPDWLRDLVPPGSDAPPPADPVGDAPGGALVGFGGIVDLEHGEWRCGRCKWRNFRPKTMHPVCVQCKAPKPHTPGGFFPGMMMPGMQIPGAFVPPGMTPPAIRPNTMPLKPGMTDMGMMCTGTATRFQVGAPPATQPAVQNGILMAPGMKNFETAMPAAVRRGEIRSAVKTTDSVAPTEAASSNSVPAGAQSNADKKVSGSQLFEVQAAEIEMLRNMITPITRQATI